MANPEEVYAQLVSASPAQMSATAQAFGAAAKKLSESERSAESAKNRAREWTGQGADAFTRRADDTIAAASLATENLTAARRALETVVSAYESARQAADRVIDVWRSTATADSDRSELARSVTAELEQLVDAYNQQLRAQAGVLARLSPAFEKTASSRSWRASRPQATPTVPPPGSDPAEVARWWRSLSDEQRDQLLLTDFERLGQLHGLPAEVLDTANRRRIDVDRVRYAAEADDLRRQALDRARELGIALDENSMREANDPALSDLLDAKLEAERRADNADAAYENLERASRNAVDNDLPPDDVHVLAYSPDGPGRKEGTLAVAFGNPDTASDVAVTVPGTGTTIGSDFTAQAANLRGEMGADGTATIAWLGYDAPDWDHSVASDIGAKDGGDRLAADVDGYRAAAEAAGTPRQHVTVIGHSYGSATVGYAGMSGMDADDIAFVGSPGVGASHADQLGGATVWAGGNEHDPVIQGTNGTYFTEDGSSGPYDPDFGARQFDTDADANVVDAHTTYYDQGSDSLRNLAHIATGDDGAVTERSYLEEPVAPGLDVPIPGADTAYRIGYEGAQVVGNLATGDLEGAAHDVVDGAANVVGGAVDTLKDGSKFVANGLGKLF
ncbi:alpha/beta hydrolase [Haloechinothrix halophila]|uniref:alpha/beta hydrolase n=1 Tax=Haloechinothrix halophila TaxID=1069073 RepID=UPI000419DEB5|nr:alpha/beta hydrolase [Haloechinothrix halophila]